MVKIVTYAHKRPDFIYYQYESIKKHLKSEYEFIVFNNSVDDINLYNEINKICSELYIKCIDVILTDDLKYINNELIFENQRYINPNFACSYPLIWTFKNCFNENDDIICIIDSDMFFINDIDIENEIKDTDIIYIPQYRDRNQVKYVWNAFVCLNIKRNKNLLNLNWHPGSVNNVGCDVGGQSHYDLIKNNFISKTIEEFSIRDLHITDNNMFVHYIQNGNINYHLTIDKNYNLLEFKNTGGDKLFTNRSFPHETEFENHSEYVLGRTKSIIEIFEKYNLNLPDPKHIGFIGFNNSQEYFILHYKSGSNYLEFTNDSYNQLKTNEIKKILNDNK